MHQYIYNINLYWSYKTTSNITDISCTPNTKHNLQLNIYWSIFSKSYSAHRNPDLKLSFWTFLKCFVSLNRSVPADVIAQNCWICITEQQHCSYARIDTERWLPCYTAAVDQAESGHSCDERERVTSSTENGGEIGKWAGREWKNLLSCHRDHSFAKVLSSGHYLN